MTTPWWATLNASIGNIIWSWVLTPILYYSDAFGMDSSLRKNGLPVLNTGSLFNRNGTAISALSLYNKTTYNINQKEYEENAPIYITTFFALAYGSSFLGITAAFTHVFLWYGKDIYRQFKAALSQMDDRVDSMDIHNVLMSSYPDFSEIHYLLFLFFCTVLQILVSL
jgi:hypothetical protein